MEIQTPQDTHIELPVGIYSPDGITDTAEIRELTGFDEEYLAKSNSPGQVLQGVLERAVVKIGDQPGSKLLLDQITLPDRVELLLRIRSLTWGPEITFGDVRCPACDDKSEITINLDKVPQRPLTDKAADRFWDVKLRNGMAKLCVPSGELHRRLILATKETTPEIATWFIADCVMEVENSVAVGVALARGMNLQDRTTLMTSINEHIPGPQLEEVKASCPKCSAESPFPLALGALFPL